MKLKKIILCICLLCLFACSEETVKISKQEKYYNEILAIEDNMKELPYFKMNKVEDKEFLYCNSSNEAEIDNKDTSVENYRFHNVDDKVEYISTTKVSDEIQYITQYYRDGKIYVSYSQLPYDIQVKESSADFVYFDMAIKAVDLKYFKITKKKDGEDTIYTLILNDAEQYNEKYPDDYDNKTCGIVADYKAVKIELRVNSDQLLLDEKITQTIHYQSNQLVSEKESVIHYQFYDLGVEDSLDFSIIE